MQRLFMISVLKSSQIINSLEFITFSRETISLLGKLDDELPSLEAVIRY